MGWPVVIAACVLALLLCGVPQLCLRWRTARDGERPCVMFEVAKVVDCAPGAVFAFVGDPRNTVRHVPRVVAMTLDAAGRPSK